MLGQVCKINSIKLRCLVHPSYNKNSATSVTEREMEIFKFKTDNLNKSFINNDIFNLKY